MPRFPRAVLIGIALFVAVYVALDLNKLYALRYGADQGTFLQFLAGMARDGSSWNGAEGRPHLQVHDSWALLALVPFVALAPRQETLVVVQVVAVALAALPLVALARDAGADARGATAVGLAYLVSPFTQGYAYGDFAENAFVPLLAAGWALAVRRRSLLGALALAQVLLGVKEDQAAFLAWFGLACALWWDRRIGAATAALAALNGIGFIAAERLAHVAPSIPGYHAAVDDPLQKALFFVTLLATFAFAPLALGVRVLLAAPLVAELAFAAPWAYVITRIGTHWTIPLFTACCVATAIAVAHRPRLATPVLACAVLAGLFLTDTVLKPGRWPYVVDRGAYARAVALRDVRAPVVLPRYQEGVYAVAAANRNVALARYRADERARYCPAYNRDGHAFLASLGLARWQAGTTLCGGVASVPR